MKLLSVLPLLSLALAAYIPGDNYSTFTPTEGLLPGASTDYTTTFGIAINPIATGSSDDTTTKDSDASEQVQAVVTQIGDGQIQATTVTEPITIAHIVSQIGDGQIQATTYTPTTLTTMVVTQIGDGQIQGQAKDNANADNTDSATTSDDTTTTLTVTPTETVLETVTSATYQTLPAETVTINKRSQPEFVVEKRDIDFACASDTALSMTLEASVLRDVKGRVGSIVSNRQFQFDGPTPQADAIFTAGWSVVDGKLALGNSTTFYQCLSGDFYNLYDENIAEQCVPVELDIVNIIKC